MNESVPLIDIRSDHWNIVRKLLQVHAPDRNVLAFGSRATWTAKEYSDLDLAFLGQEPIPHDVLSTLSEELRDSDLPFKVDLVDCSRIDDKLRLAICRDGVMLQVSSDTKQVANLICNRSFPLRDLVDLTLSSVDKKTKEHERKVYLCNYMDVYSNAFIRSGLDFMPATASEREIKRCQIRTNDVIITKDSEEYDDIGVPALVKEDVDSLLCGYHLAILRPNPSILDGTYLYYALQIPTVQHQFHAFANGVTRFGLRKNDILRTEVPIHELGVQQAIGRVLSNLDEKIELNRRMNETLEGMVRAIFKDWFVDFGPVRAKMEERKPYLPPDLWDLFPDRLNGSGIPIRWVEGTLSEIATSPRRYVQPIEVATNTPYIGLEHMPRCSISINEWSIAGVVSSNKFEFRRGEVLFGKLAPYFHKVVIAPIDGICSTDIVVVVPLLAEWKAFVLACVSSKEFVDYTDQTSTGTTMPRTNWTTMSQYKFVLPSSKCASAFQTIVQPLVDSICINIHVSRILAQVRDTLRPKLISGEVHIEASKR